MPQLFQTAGQLRPSFDQTKVTADTGLSEGLKVAAGALKEREDFLEKQEIDAENADVRQSMTEGGLEWTKALKERADTVEPGASGFSKSLEDDLDAWILKGRESYTTPEGQRSYDLSSAQLKASIVSRGMAFEGKENARFSVQQVGQSVDDINNRATEDSSYYRSGEAQKDLDAQVLALEERGVPKLLVANQKKEWEDRLHKTGAFSELNESATSVSAATSFTEKVKTSKEFQKNLGTADYSTLLSAARRNVVTATSAELTASDRADTVVRNQHTEQITTLMTLLSGPNRDPAALGKLEAVRADALKYPSRYTPSSIAAVDRALDARDPSILAGKNTVAQIDVISQLEALTPKDIKRLKGQALSLRNAGTMTPEKWATIEARLNKATEGFNEGPSKADSAALDRYSQRDDLTPKQISEALLQNDKLLRVQGASYLPKWTTIGARLDSDLIKARRAKEEADRVSAHILGNHTILTPTNSEDVKAVTSVYDSLIAGQWKDLSPEVQATSKVQYVKNTGIVPTSLRDEITAKVNSGQPDAVIEAMNLMTRLEATNPQISSQMDKGGEAISFGRQVLQYANWGFEPKDAVARATKLRNVPDAEKKARKASFGTATAGLRVDHGVDAHLGAMVDDNVFGSDDAPMEPNMKAEYLSMVQDEYVRSGDVEVAKGSAIAMLRKTWGTHYYEGTPVFMKRPPHLFYGRGNRDAEQNSAWIMEEAERFVLKNGAMAGDVKGRIRLIPHLTQSNKNLPAYTVLILPTQGQVGLSAPQEVQGVNGKAVAWYPSWDLSKQKQRDLGRLHDAIAQSRSNAADVSGLGTVGGGG